MNIEAIFTTANTSYEHCISIVEVMRSNPVQTEIFFRSYFQYCESSVHHSEFTP